MKKSKFIVPLLLLLILLWAPVESQDYRWEIVTNLNEIQKVQLHGDTLFAASTGGLILYDIQSGSYDSWTAEDGISDQHFTAMARSGRNSYILGSESGVLTFFNPQSGELTENRALLGNEISGIQAVGDTLWVSAANIVAVFLYAPENGSYSFRDFFTNFNINVGSFTDIKYYRHRIWVTSDVGLFSAPGNFLKYNLKAGESWQRQTTADGLPADGLLSLCVKGDSLLIGTQNGLSILNNSTFSNFFLGLYGRNLIEIFIHQNNIFVNNTYGIYQFENQNFVPWQVTPNSDVQSAVIDENGEVWAAIRDNGMRNLSTGNEIRFNGIIDNSVGEPLLDSQGRLWVVSGGYKDERAKGFSVKMPDGVWHNYKFLGAWRSTASAMGLMEDAAGYIWMGSWNGGLVIFDKDMKMFHFNNYTNPGMLWHYSGSSNDTTILNPPDSLRHFFSSTLNAPDLLVVNDFVRDDVRNRIWMITTAVESGQPLISLNQNSFSENAYDSDNWERIALPYGFNPNDLNAAVTLDIFGNIWIGTERSGVIEMQVKQDGTLGWRHLEEKDNLKNIRVWSIAADQDGYVWLGTFGGLNTFFNGQVLSFSGEAQPIGIRINAIFVDNENNKWFATDKGVSLLKASGSPWDVNSWVHFVPQYSESFADNVFHTNLPSEEIRGIFVDNKSGDIYCGTTSGLAILRNNPFTTPKRNLDKTRKGPNPFIIRDNQPNWFYIRNLTANSEVKILTASGRLIKNLNEDDPGNILGSVARWDGRNRDGRLVASGVYLYLVTDESGNAAQGKFVVIHK